MVMQVITDLSKEVPVSSMLVKVVDGIDDKKDHFLEILPVAHPLLGVGVLTGKQSSSQKLTMMTVSRESNQSVQAGGVLG